MGLRRPGQFHRLPPAAHAHVLQPNLYGACSATGGPNSFTTYTSGIRIGNAIEAPLLQKTNDGSPGFRADATFYRVAGLADGGWSSFRSYNFPTHHLRHQGYVLRIDPISSSSSAADRQDATFRVTA
ncbi:AbfB domain-containing protein [Nonomuraea jabiensis]|uniref:AbfB domain-containing protein n=1 Tax=Nonomuraea jabiensis TaxID=882448 RepID=UPI003D713A2B